MISPENRRSIRRTAVRTLLGLLILGVLVTGIYFLGLVLQGEAGDPTGKYASFDLYPHSKGDVIEFKDGIATLRTCCGDSDFGTYSREEGGRWIWVWQETLSFEDGKRKTDPVRIRLTPGRFSLRIDVEDPAQLDPDSVRSMKLRRRLFEESLL